MGYYTAYSMECRAPRGNEVEIAKRLGEISGLYDPADVTSIYDPFERLDYDTYKWYDYESDMDKLSAEYPDTWFLLEGQGEEVDDRWREVFHAGVHSFSQAHVCYDPFINVFEDDIPF